MKKKKPQDSEHVDTKKQRKDPAARATALGLSSMQSGYGNAGVVNASLALRVEEKNARDKEDEKSTDDAD